MYFSALCGLWAASLTTTLQMLVIPLLHNNQNISRCCQSSLGGVGACWVPLLLVASFSFFFHFTLFSLHPPSHLPILPHVCICVLCVHVHAHGHTHMHMGSSKSMRSMTTSLLNQSLLLVFEKESLCKAEPFFDSARQAIQWASGVILPLLSRSWSYKNSHLSGFLQTRLSSGLMRHLDSPSCLLFIS